MIRKFISCVPDHIPLLFGWVIGLGLTVFISVPFIAEKMHMNDPVYEVPRNARFVCFEDGVGLVAETTKLHPFIVLDKERPGWIKYSYTSKYGQHVSDTAPFLDYDEKLIDTRPSYNAGDTFRVGPLKVPLPTEVTNVRVYVVLPGYRYGFLRTFAEIGPLMWSGDCGKAPVAKRMDSALEQPTGRCHPRWC